MMVIMGFRPGTVLFVTVLAGEAFAQPGATPPSRPPPPVPQSTLVAPQPAAPEAPASPEHTICFFGRPYECASLMLLEAGVRAGNGNGLVYADFGLLLQDGLDAYGGVVGVAGVEGEMVKHDASVLFAGRYRRYIGDWGLSTEVQLGYAGGPTMEVAFGWADVLAVTAGLNNYELENGDRDWVAGVGFRVGAVTIGGLFYLTALVATSAR